MNPLFLGLLTGIAFGYILRRSHAADCKCISGTLEFRDLHILKMMLLAVAIGTIVLFPLSTLGLTHFSVKETQVLANSIGGIIFGVGFAVAGYCPGTALAALVSRRKDALYTVLGGLVGALAYSAGYPIIKPLLLEPLAFGKITLPDLLGVPAVPMAIAFGLLLLGVVVLLNHWESKSERAA